VLLALSRVAALAALAGMGVTACFPGEGEVAARPLSLSADDRLVAEDQAGGRTWRVYNNCAMAVNTTWVSDDGGKNWLSVNGPGFINCSNGSAVRLDAVSRSEATAEVDHGPEPVHERWRTTDGGETWTMTSTDLGG
jgi:hypothetical protein